MELYAAVPLIAISALYNVLVFGIYWRDKRAARNGHWRISEKTLLLLAFVGGGAGAFAAQRMLRHKTRKPPFNIVLPLVLVLQLTWLAVAIFAPDALAALWQRLMPT